MKSLGVAQADSPILSSFINAFGAPPPNALARPFALARAAGAADSGTRDQSTTVQHHRTVPLSVFFNPQSEIRNANPCVWGPTPKRSLAPSRSLGRQALLAMALGINQRQSSTTVRSRCLCSSIHNQKSAMPIRQSALASLQSSV